MNEAGGYVEVDGNRPKRTYRLCSAMSAERGNAKPYAAVDEN